MDWGVECCDVDQRTDMTGKRARSDEAPVGLGMRMLRSRRDARVERTGALERVREWTRERFVLGRGATVMVVEVACALPGCPPIETVIVFWSDDKTRHQFKLFKPVGEVVADDLPPAWLKPALVVDENAGFECC
jgi:hypothetical protein